MVELEALRSDLEAAVLDFERENRSYFARSVTDRGDRFFEEFADRYRALMVDQECGKGAFYVSVDAQGAVVGRFNLYGIGDGTASVGYRIAERVAGRGVATSGLRTLCGLARDDIGLQRLTAIASNENGASQRVLMKAGFVPVGPTDVEGRDGSGFELDLSSL